ncbi:MAG: DUF4139 domain-containing protein [Lachnospiraceae bacterium]|nr:DUF4139 domain-containing protein [Lachnospiraceae bacterium]
MEQVIHTTCKEAAIYFQGCSQIRRGKAELKAGRNAFYIEGLTKSAQTDSITLRFAPGVSQGSIGIVNKRRGEESEERRAEEELSRKLQRVERKIEQNRSLFQLWMTNGNVSNKTEVTPQEAVDYMEQLPARIAALDEEFEALLTEHEELEKEQKAPSRFGAYLSVELDAEKDGSYDFELEFIDRNAAWRPQYEIRVTDGKSPVLKTRARAFQMTGEDWEDVKLKLIADTPDASGTRPQLHPWNLRIEAPEVLRDSAPRMRRKMAMESVAMAGAAPGACEEAELLMMDEAVPLESFSMPAAVRNEQQTMTEYLLEGRWNLESLKENSANGQGKLIDLEAEELTAKLCYYTVPKLSDGVYLVALVENSEALGRVDGEADVYLNDAYTGKVTLESTRTDEETELPLGKDRQIKVIRKQTKRYVSKTMLSGEKKTEFAYEIAVVNHKSREAEIVVLDQLPRTQDKSITVETLDTGGAERNEDSGELRWTMTLQPEETKTVTFGFEVRHPKDARVYL